MYLLMTDSKKLLHIIKICKTMKPQDIIFFIVVLVGLMLGRPKYFVWIGLLSLCLAIPLFARWIFFTAERLTWYAAGYFMISIVLSRLIPLHNYKNRDKKSLKERPL